MVLTKARVVIPEESEERLGTESKLEKGAQIESTPANNSNSNVSQAGSNSPVRILKSESTFAKSFGSRNR
jgi:hypothetical protein